MSRETAVQSVDRALQLLEILATRPDGARLADLTAATGLAPATAHRLLTALEQRGFVQHVAPGRHWQIGATAFAVGIAFTRWQALIAAARPWMRRLRDTTRETVNLGVLMDGDVVTVAQVESREIMRAVAPPGGRTPVMNSAMGKAIVATWTDAEITALVARHGLRPMTRHSLRDMAAVTAEITTIRRSGFAVDEQEFTIGLRCVAAVVRRGTGGEALAAISVSGLAQRLGRDQVAPFGRLVTQLTAELSASLDPAPPPSPPSTQSP